MPGWQLFKSLSKLIKLNNWLTKWSAFTSDVHISHIHRSLPKTAPICISAASGGDILNIQTESDKSWRVTTTAAVFNIPRFLIEPLTQIVIYFFQIRHMSRIVIVGLVNIHHFHPKDYTSYLKWYSIKYDRGNTEWSVLAWIWLMVWKRKKHFIGIKMEVKITWGNST